MVSSIKRDVVNEIHKSARVNFPRRRVILKGINDLVQIDLIEMIPYARLNRGYKYILVCINCFSKKVWVEPLKKKSAEDVANAMQKILNEMKEKPKNLQSDLGKEFYNKSFGKLMKKFKINHYSVWSSKKASIVERFNRTFKNLLWKRFSLQGSYKWLNILKELADLYNNTVHRTIGMKPKQVTAKNEKKILSTVYSIIKMRNLNSKFNVGDQVRISKYRSLFDKSYTPNWSNEIFTVRKVQSTHPITYLLKDENNEDISGGFYEMELQRVKHRNVLLVEKVVRRKGNKMLVKWLGLDNSKNSWISSDNVK